MPSPHWTLETASGLILVSSVLGELDARVPGREIQPRLWFAPEPSAASSMTERWQAVEDYIAAANETTIRTGRRADGTPYYREETTGFPAVDSFLVSLTPESGGSTGVWAVITGGRDQSTVTRDRLQWELSLVVLTADSGESRSTIESTYSDPL